MSSRRGHGEGSIFRRQDGKWVAQVNAGRGPDGRRRRRTRTATTRQEATQLMRQMVREVDAGTADLDRKLTVGGWLQRWLTDEIGARLATGDIRPRTVEGYRQHVRDHIIPAVGAVRMAEFKPAHVRTVHSALAARGLSASSIVKAHRVLSKAMADAVRDEVIAANPVTKVSPPRIERTEVRPPSLADVARVLEAVRGSRDEAAYVVLASCGLRIGECLGLAWADVDLGSATVVRVRRQLGRRLGKLEFSEPKSARSRRTLTLPTIALDALRAHRTAQVKERVSARYWEDHGLVFPTSVGTPTDPRNFLRSWHRIRADLGMDGVRIHDFRHAAASFALAAGVPVRSVSEMMGHSSTAMTADVYGHVLEATRRHTAEVLDGVFDGIGAAQV